MSRMNTFFAIVLPSMLAGGVLFGSAFSRADAGLGIRVWTDNSATVVAQATPPTPPAPPSAASPAAPPAPPAPHVAPPPRVAQVPRVPPVPPVPPVPGSGGMPADVRTMVDDQIRQAIDQVKSNPNIPADVRAKILKRLEKVRVKTQEKLKRINVHDLDQFGEQMGEIGEEIGEEFGEEMSEFGDDMEKWGDKFGKQIESQVARQLEHQLGNNNKHGGMHIHISPQVAQSHDGDDDDDDDDDDNNRLTTVPDVDDQDDLDDAVIDLGDLSLKPPQRDQIQKLRADSDRQVAVAKHQLEVATAALKKQLENLAANDADLARAIDAVSQQEAAIRKARILAWHDARRVLDDAQRKKVVDAVKSKTK